ncbi:hypothetical protein AB1Y20_003308 [Prymnesium parvum]|uniref:Cyclic nucleotide-binding domain-containing protein n=1 Tax=Prymnesium parvum TaxID=97485 RepID=A0AB34JDV5_PRYPA
MKSYLGLQRHLTYLRTKQKAAKNLFTDVQNAELPLPRVLVRRMSGLQFHWKKTGAAALSAILKGSSAAKKGRDLHVEVSEAEIRARVREALSPISLSDAQLTELLELAERRTYPRYATVIREGAAGNHAFVLVHGVLNVHRVRHGVTLNHVATPGPYGLFGESGMQARVPFCALACSKLTCTEA